MNLQAALHTNTPALFKEPQAPSSLKYVKLKQTTPKFGYNSSWVSHGSAPLLSETIT